MDYILRYSITEDDCDFLNSTTIEYEITDSEKDPYRKLVTQVNEMFDSGWCDMATGARIISEQDRVVFRNVTEQEKTLLLLKYGDRLKLLTLGMKRIYNIVDINKGEENVVD